MRPRPRSCGADTNPNQERPKTMTKLTNEVKLTLTVRELVNLRDMAFQAFMAREELRASLSKKWEDKHGEGNLAPESVARHAREDENLVNLLSHLVEAETKGKIKNGNVETFLKYTTTPSVH